jgi:prevent-host-death family protein
MVEISSATAGRDFAKYREQAEKEPVIVLHYNKPSVVIVAAAEFERLKRRDKQTLSIEEMPDWLVRQVVEGKMQPRHDHLDSVVAPEGFDKGALTETGDRPDRPL